MFIIRTFFLSLLLYLSLVLVLSFTSFYQTPPLEKNFYSLFAQSMVTDGDLNIINQVPEAERWLVTKTYHHPTHLDKGIVAVLMPVFLLIKASKLDLKHANYDSYDLAFILLNLFAFWASLFIANYILKRNGFNRRKSLLWLSLFVFSTPLIYYTLFSPINSELIVMLLGFIFWIATLQFNETKDRPLIYYVLWGAFAATCLAFKTSMIFIMPVLYYLLIKNSEAISSTFLKFKFNSAIILGFIGIFTFILINNYLQLGFIANLYSYLTTTSFFSLKETLFYPNGYFVTSPFYLLLFLIPFFSIFKKATLIKISLLSLLLLIIFSAFKIPGNDSLYGPKLFLPLTVLFLILIPSTILNKYQGIIFSIISLFMIINLIMMTQYMQDNISTPWATYYWESSNFQNIFSRIVVNAKNTIHFSPDILLKLTPFFPFALGLGILLNIFYSWDNFRAKSKSIIACTLLSLITFSFIIFSSLNILNAQAQVTKLKEQNFFSRSVVSHGAELYLYDEILDITNTSILIHERFRDTNDVAKRKEYLNSYKNIILNQIDYDPIGFKQDLQNNIFRNSSWVNYKGSRQ